MEEKKAWINLLIYGDPGTGKTVLAGSAAAVPSMGPVLFVDIEGGTFSLRSFYPDVDVVRVADYNDLQAVYEFLWSGKSGYNTVVIDSLTELQKFSMNNIMKDLIKKHPERDPDIPSIQEWGKNIEQIRKTVRAFRDLPMHFIATALLKTEKNTRTGKIHNKPYLSGKLADEIAGFMDIVVFLFKQVRDEQLVRVLQTVATETTVAKDRSARLPQTLIEPAFVQLHSGIFEESKQQKKETNKEKVDGNQG